MLTTTMTKAEIQKLKDKMNERFDSWDDYDAFIGNVIDCFGMCDWGSAIADAIGTAFEIQTPEEWAAASDMFCAFVGVPLEDMLNNFCGKDGEEDA